MRIAILGSTSEIAKDLIASFSGAEDKQLHLFARRPAEVQNWLVACGLSGRYPVDDFLAFSGHEFDAVINFVGVGNPAQAAVLGSGIFELTQKFDELALDYLRLHPACRYLFLSSGAAYGQVFSAPATRDTMAAVPINNLSPQDWYGAAKLHAECRHRAHPEHAIFDIRVFNYFSHTQDISARFLITDILRAIRDRAVLKTSSDYIVRDFLHPRDFHKLVTALLSAPATNTAVDCYTRAPIDKLTLLAAMHENFGLQYEVVSEPISFSATGAKTHYYSKNYRAVDFGYQPELTSLEGVLLESEQLVKGWQ